MPKIEPAVTQLMYLVPDGTSYIDLAKDLSKVNRRLYRQGYTYVVQDIQVGVSAGLRSSDIQQFAFYTAGNSYLVHNAWSKAFRTWRRQQRDITSHMGDISGKWADFKVYLDDAMAAGTILEPYAGDAAVYQAGEWEHSKLVFDDDGTEREFKMHLIGSTNLADSNNASAIGLIHEMNIAARITQSPDPAVFSSAGDGIYAKMIGTDEMSDMLVDNIEDDNDNPPYDHDEYPGGHTNADSAVPVRFGSVSGAQSMSTMAGFIAPCGLIKVSTNEMALGLTADIVAADGSTVDAPGPLSVYANGAAATAAVLVTVATGPYRGVLAAPMGQ